MGLRGLLRQKLGAAIIREPCGSENHKNPNATTSLQKIGRVLFVKQFKKEEEVTFCCAIAKKFEGR